MIGLLREKERTSGDLALRTGMTKPATSQQLKVMRDAGLIKVRKDGRRRVYSVDPRGMEKLRAELVVFWETSHAFSRAAERKT